jgi:predicted DNA-binding transcriptional regulator AlpA
VLREKADKAGVEGRAHKLQDDVAYPPRAMRAERAAAYLDLSPSTFLRFVDEGLLPPPTKVRGVVSWDRLDLDSAYEDWKAASGDGGNTMHRILRERGK